MNRGQLAQRVSVTIGLGMTGADDESQMVYDVLNEGILDILARTRLNVKRVRITLTANESAYDLGPTVLVIRDLYRGTTRMQEVADGDVSLFGDSSSYALVGFNQIQLGLVAAAGDYIDANYTPRPTPMTADAHDPSVATYGAIPPQFHKAIVDYACWQLADAAGDAGSGRGEKYRILYEGQDGTGKMGSDLGKIKFEINKRAASGSRMRRVKRTGERNAGDVAPETWVS